MLHRYTTLIPTIRKISTRDIDRARARVALSHSPLSMVLASEKDAELPRVSTDRVQDLYRDKAVIVLDGYVVEIGSYAHEHPGGEGLLRAYYGGMDATSSFKKLNHHTAHARGLVEDMRIARVV